MSGVNLQKPVEGGVQNEVKVGVNLEKPVQNEVKGGVHLEKPVQNEVKGGVHLEKPVQNEVKGGVHLEKPVEQPVQNEELSGVQLEKPVENIQVPNGLENQNQFSKYTSGIFDGKNINMERVHEVENIVNNTLEGGLNNVLGKLGNTMEGVTNKFNDFLNGLDK